MDTKQYPLLTSADLIAKGAKIALYGSGEFGEQVYEWCKAERPDVNVAMFLDSSSGGSVHGLPQVKAADYAQGQDRVDCILVTSHFSGEIGAHLEELKIDNFYVFDRSVMGLLQFMA